MKRYIRAYSDDGKGYWYHARHGVGPGTIPSDVHLLKVVEDPENSWKDYFLLDRALTTSELSEYDLKEQCPPGITAATSPSKFLSYENQMTFKKGTHRFAVYFTDPGDFGNMHAIIYELHAYDDANYIWARIDGLNVTFLDKETEIDKMHLWSYEEEYYDGEINEYITDVVSTICDDLIEMNKDVKPVMVHN